MKQETIITILNDETTSQAERVPLLRTFFKSNPINSETKMSINGLSMFVSDFWAARTEDSPPRLQGHQVAARSGYQPRYGSCAFHIVEWMKGEAREVHKREISISAGNAGFDQGNIDMSLQNLKKGGLIQGVGYGVYRVTQRA